MPISEKSPTRDIALTICFAALYTVLAFLPLNQLIASVGKAITAATIIAPIIGIILGPYLSMSSTFLGGVIALFFSPYFSIMSLIAGIIAALCAALLYAGKRLLCALVYGLLMIIFGFYPVVGPVWVYPVYMWLQIIGFLVLISPLQSAAIKHFHSQENTKLSYSFLTTLFTTTMASQIAGTLVFEMIYWPAIFPDANYWKSTLWPSLTFVYPIERTIIMLIGFPIGVALYKSLKSANLLSVLNKPNTSQSSKTLGR